MSRKNIFKRLRNVWNTLVSKETPRELQERNDLYKVALASTYRKIRLDNCSPKAVKSGLTNEELGDMFDLAAESLESEAKAHELPIRSLRRHVQSLIQPQALNILNACKEVDTELQIVNGDHDKNMFLIEKCRDILLHEQSKLKEKLDATTSNKVQQEYFKQKFTAIQILSDYYDWNSPLKSAMCDYDIAAELGKGDAFGYYLNKDESINKSIRHYQLINITKALLLRDRLGYSSISLKSTITDAGRGIFIDGFAPAGSLIAFFGGRVWPKEYLLNVNASSSIFENDPKQQLSMRYDDILIDSRNSPYTVLDNENSNAFALAHIVNHPARLETPNCSTVMVDFMEKMELGKDGLDKYVPNTYIKPPMLFGPNTMDREKVSMHSFGLVSTRDVENEEIFYDYRLSGNKSEHPDWYHIVNEEESRNRWLNSNS